MLLSATDILQKSWQDFKDHWHEWMVFSLLIFLPAFILVLIGSIGSFINAYIPETISLTNLLIVLIAIISLFIGFWSSLALIHAVDVYLENKQTEPWKTHYIATIGFIWPAFYTTIFVGIVVVLGLILFVIPGIIFWLWYYFSLYEVIVGSNKGVTAMRASRRIVKGRWFSVFWKIFLPNLVIAAGVILIQVVASIFYGLLPLNLVTDTVIANIVSSILGAIVTPLTTLVALNLYKNLKENPLQEAPTPPLP